MGLRLRDLPSRWLSWRDLMVICKERPRDTALSRALLGDEWLWGSSEQLLAAVVDELRVSNWQRGAKRGDPPPKRIERPGVTDDTKRFSTRDDALPLDEMRSWLGWDLPSPN